MFAENPTNNVITLALGTSIDSVGERTIDRACILGEGVFGFDMERAG